MQKVFTKSKLFPTVDFHIYLPLHLSMTKIIEALLKELNVFLLVSEKVFAKTVPKCCFCVILRVFGGVMKKFKKWAVTF